MAYDPNDQKDVEFLEAEIEKATSRLKAKNEELIGELRQARAGKVDPQKVEKLENELEATRQSFEELQRNHKKLERDHKTASDALAERGREADSLRVSRALKDAMTEHKIAPQFHEAVEAMFAGKATIKADGSEKVVMLGDKPLGDALKEFAASDNGKHFVAAANNSGGGSQGNRERTGSGKQMTRSSFDALSPEAKRQATVVDKVQIIDG